MPTRLDPEFDRSVARLDMSASNSGIFTRGLESIEILDDEVQRFNALAHVLNDAMPDMSSDQLAGVARRVLRTAAAGGESPFVRSRMRRAAEMRTMSLDTAWSLGSLQAQRISALLDYLDDPHGLIHDHVPIVGRLDDALLVDIGMDSLRGELDEYAEFCRFRAGLAAYLHISADDGSIDRTRWQREREDERRLEHQLHRVRDSSYTSSAAERIFRVC